MFKYRSLEIQELDSRFIPLSGNTIPPKNIPIEAYVQAHYHAEIEAAKAFANRDIKTPIVLDIGAGDGQFCSIMHDLLQPNKFRAIWVDRSRKLMDEGLSQVSYSKYVKCIQADLEKEDWIMKIQKSNISYVTIGLVYHYISPQSYKNILENALGSLLNPFGRLIVVELCGGLDANKSPEWISDEIIKSFPKETEFIDPSPEILNVSIQSPFFGMDNWCFKFILLGAKPKT